MTEQFTVHREPAGPTGSSPEGVCAPDYQFGRVLSPVGTYDGDVVPDSICAMLVVEGSGVVHQGNVTTGFSTGRLLVLDGALPMTVEVTRPTAHYAWRFRSSMLTTPEMWAAVGSSVTAAPSVWGPARVLANALIGADPAVSHSADALRASELVLASILSTAVSVRRA